MLEDGTVFEKRRTGEEQPLEFITDEGEVFLIYFSYNMKISYHKYLRLCSRVSFLISSSFLKIDYQHF